MKEKRIFHKIYFKNKHKNKNLAYGEIVEENDRYVLILDMNRHLYLSILRDDITNIIKIEKVVKR